MVSITFSEQDGICRFTATNGNQTLGNLRCRFSDETVEVTAVYSDDAVISEAMIRAALNAGLERGCRQAVCPKEMETMARRLRFAETENGFAVDLTAFFSRPCSGKAI